MMIVEKFVIVQSFGKMEEFDRKFVIFKQNYRPNVVPVVEIDLTSNTNHHVLYV